MKGMLWWAGGSLLLVLVTIAAMLGSHVTSTWDPVDPRTLDSFLADTPPHQLRLASIDKGTNHDWLEWGELNLTDGHFSAWSKRFLLDMGGAPNHPQGYRDLDVHQLDAVRSRLRDLAIPSNKVSSWASLHTSVYLATRLSEGGEVEIYAWRKNQPPPQLTHLLQIVGCGWEKVFGP